MTNKKDFDSLNESELDEANYNLFRALNKVKSSIVSGIDGKEQSVLEFLKEGQFLEIKRSMELINDLLQKNSVAEINKETGELIERPLNVDEQLKISKHQMATFEVLDSLLMISNGKNGIITYPKKAKEVNEIVENPNLPKGLPPSLKPVDEN